jgi:hypothetical protein
VVDGAVDQGGGNNVVAEHFTPPAERLIADDQAGPLVAGWRRAVAAGSAWPWLAISASHDVLRTDQAVPPGKQGQSDAGPPDLGPTLPRVRLRAMRFGRRMIKVSSLIH